MQLQGLGIFPSLSLEGPLLVFEYSQNNADMDTATSKRMLTLQTHTHFKISEPLLHSYISLHGRKPK